VGVAKLSLKLAQKGQKQNKSRKQKLSLSYGWQRDLVEFSAIVDSESAI